MSTHTITSNVTGATSNPLAVTDYAKTRESRNIVHDTLDGGIGVSYIPPRPSSGTYTFHYRNEVDAVGCYELHARAGSFTFSTTALTLANRTYAVSDGGVGIMFDPAIQHWIVTVGFQEIS